jgi:hypothetical protein
MRIRWLRIRIQRLRIHILGACRYVLIPTAPPEFTIDSSLRSGKGTAVGYEISGAGVPFCPSPPFPSSPASGRGDETYGWANSRSPLHLSPTWLIIPIARAEFTIAPLLQVPPASRGEPRKGSVPPACRGNLKEGVIGHTRFCELWLRDWYNINCAVKVYNSPLLEVPPASRGEPSPSVPPACRGNLQEGVVTCHFFVNFGAAIGIRVHRLGSLWARGTRFLLPSPPAPLPLCRRGV